MKTSLLVNAVVAAMLAGTAVSAGAATAAAPMEKCYGVAKAGSNDCATKGGNACQGQAKQDRDGKVWIYVPTGVCKKIAGGSTTSS